MVMPKSQAEPTMLGTSLYESDGETNLLEGRFHKNCPYGLSDLPVERSLFPGEPSKLVDELD